MVRFKTEAENSFNSVERVVEYMKLPQEAAQVIENRRPPAVRRCDATCARAQRFVNWCMRELLSRAVRVAASVSTELACARQDRDEGAGDEVPVRGVE
jgi:hypothetical protein